MKLVNWKYTILLLFFLGWSAEGMAQLKLSNYKPSNMYISAANRNLSGNPKKLIYKSENDIEKIEFNADSTINSETYLHKKYKHKQERLYYYDSIGNITKSEYFYELQQIKETVMFYRTLDSIMIITYSQYRNSNYIASVSFEKVDNKQRIKTNISFSNEGLRNPLSYFDSTLLKKISNIDTAIIYYKKGIFRKANCNITYFDTLLRPIHITYEDLSKRKCYISKGCFKALDNMYLQYNDLNSGIIRYYPHGSDRPIYNNHHFYLDKDNSIISQDMLQPANEYEEIHAKKKKIKLDKHRNWRKRKIYDESQKKWITQHRKITYW